MALGFARLVISGVVAWGGVTILKAGLIMRSYRGLPWYFKKQHYRMF